MLLKRLEEHATQPKFVYTHKWRKGDFFIWNNLCLMHRALRNYEMEAHRGANSTGKTSWVETSTDHQRGALLIHAVRLSVPLYPLNRPERTS